MLEIAKAWAPTLRHSDVWFENDPMGNRWRDICQERRILARSDCPILTASVVGDVVMSQAHRSDATDIAAFLSAFKNRPYYVDVAQYLPSYDHHRALTLAHTGRLVARNPLLHETHNRATRIVRKTSNLNSYFDEVTDFFMDELVKRPYRPIITFHDAVGEDVCDYLQRHNIKNIPVVHYISDPSYVRDNYLVHKNLSFVYYFAFDDRTRVILEYQGVPKEKIYVTGFPLSDRIKTIREQETWERYSQELSPEPKKKLKVGIFTGGLGGNQQEIMQVAAHLQYKNQQGIFYCGTNTDLADKLKGYFTARQKEDPTFRYKMVSPEEDNIPDFDNINEDAVVVVGKNLDDLIPISDRIINDCQVICTKPSGDFGVKVMMAGKLMVLLGDWGDHETINRNEIIKSTPAYLNIEWFEFDKIGEILDRMYRNKALFYQAQRLRERLLVNPPYRYDWKQATYLALREIKLKAKAKDEVFASGKC